MNGNGSVLMVILFVGAGVAFLVLSIVLDDDRIRRYLASKGGQLLEKSWQPFGPGWFGEKNDRIYLIAYRDAAGDLHQAYAKTSLFSGVYLRDDQIVRRASGLTSVPTTAESARLREENARLREELERLKDKEAQ